MALKIVRHTEYCKNLYSVLSTVCNIPVGSELKGQLKQ